jgi:hypothetical protein
MASLKDAVTLTAEVNELAGRLHSELSQGDPDFNRMSDLATTISRHADDLASAFAAINEALQQTLDGSTRGA